MKNKLLFFALSLAATNALQSQPELKLVSQKINEAKAHLHKDAALGLRAISEQYLEIQQLVREVREGRAERSELLNELIEWRDSCQKSDAIRFKTDRDLAEIKRDVEKLKEQNKITSEKYEALVEDHRKLELKKNDIAQQYFDLYEQYNLLEKENIDLKYQISALKKELSYLAQQDFKKRIKVNFVLKNRKKDDRKLNSDDNVVPRRKYDAIEFLIEFSVSKYADINPISHPIAKVEFTYQDGKKLSRQIELEVTEEKGFWVFSAKKTFDEDTVIRHLGSTISVVILGREKEFSQKKEIRFDNK